MAIDGKALRRSFAAATARSPLYSGQAFSTEARLMPGQVRGGQVEENAPLLSSLALVRVALRRADAAGAAWAKAEDACRLSMTAPGVGPAMALAFASAVGAPERFAKSRAVGAYVGLASRRWQSGEVERSGRISRRGDAMLRSLLYECASCPPARARRVKMRTDRKKARVALARRLAAVRRRMTVTGEAFRWPEARPAAA